MGVMRCDRSGCESILCNLYSDEFGYICNGCFDELRTEYQDIRKFMKTPKTSNRINRLRAHQEMVDATFCIDED
jgi:hypothetical protein